MINNGSFVHKIRNMTQKQQFRFFKSKYVSASVVNLCIFLLILTKYLFVLSMCKLTFLYWVCWLYSPVLQRHKMPFYIMVPLWRSLWENKRHRIKFTRLFSCCHILSKYSHGQKGWNSNSNFYNCHCSTLLPTTILDSHANPIVTKCWWA